MNDNKEKLVFLLYNHFSEFLNINNIILIAIIIIMILIIYKRRNKESVNYGEKIVSKKLKKLNRKKYKVINDVLIKRENGTSQIDHIVVSIYGVFVIETKDYFGKIFGGEYQDYWKQSIYGQDKKIRNPIRQNYGHVQCLKEKLDNNKIKYISIITFTKKSKLFITTNTPVIYTEKLKRCVKSYKEEVLTYEDVEEIYEEILSYNLLSKRAKKKHNKNINKNVSKINKKLKKNRCPKCGKRLKVINGEYGQIIVCKKYPKCSFTMTK